MNPIAAKISSKPTLNAKVATMLKGTGLSLDSASIGFKNQGQFIAALHVSQNLGIPFADLKNQMVTQTGTGAAATTTQTKSLGQAIQAVKKTADATTEAQKAETQANGDLKSTTGTTPGSTSTTSKNKTKKKTTNTGGAQ